MGGLGGGSYGGYGRGINGGFGGDVRPREVRGPVIPNMRKSALLSNLPQLLFL